MIKYQCWFCGMQIGRADASAVRVTLQSLWSAQSDDAPVQSFQVHSACATERLSGSMMAFDPSIFDRD